MKRNRSEIDPGQLLLERMLSDGDVQFVQLEERGWSYPACGRPIWWGSQLMGRCEAKGTWSVDLPAGKRLYCTGHAHSTLEYVDAFAESKRYEERLAAKAAERAQEKTTPKFSGS